MVTSQANYTCSLVPHTAQLPRKGEGLPWQLQLHCAAVLGKSSKTGFSQWHHAFRRTLGHHESWWRGSPHLPVYTALDRPTSAWQVS